MMIEIESKKKALQNVIKIISAQVHCERRANAMCSSVRWPCPVIGHRSMFAISHHLSPTASLRFAHHPFSSWSSVRYLLTVSHAVSLSTRARGDHAINLALSLSGVCARVFHRAQNNYFPFIKVYNYRDTVFGGIGGHGAHKTGLFFHGLGIYVCLPGIRRKCICAPALNLIYYNQL